MATEHDPNKQSQPPRPAQADGLPPATPPEAPGSCSVWHTRRVAVSTIRTSLVLNLPDPPPIYRHFPWLTPEQVARAIRRALDGDQFLVYVNWQSWGIHWLTRLAPRLTDRLVRRWSQG